MSLELVEQQFQVPEVQITSEDLVPIWLESKGCKDLGGFIQTLTYICRSTKMTETVITNVSKSMNHRFRI